jgi:hypothetical protein
MAPWKIPFHRCPWPSGRRHCGPQSGDWPLPIRDQILPPGADRSRFLAPILSRSLHRNRQDRRWLWTRQRARLAKSRWWQRPNPAGRSRQAGRSMRRQRRCMASCLRSAGPKVAAPIVELLAAGRIGANFFFRVAADAEAKALPSGIGQLLVAVAAVVAQDGVRLPGHRRLASRQG